MGFFTKNKPIDCYKKVNKLISKMYYIKKTLIIKGNSTTDSDRQTLSSQLDDAIDYYNSIIKMDFSSTYVLMKSDIMFGTIVYDYENERLSLNDFMLKTSKEINAIKRIVKGAPVVMSEINPNSISKDFFYDEHKLGVCHSAHINDPRFELPPMFVV